MRVRRWFSVPIALMVLALALPQAGATHVALAAGLNLSRGAAAPGDAVSVSGSGFAAGTNVVVSADFRAGGQPRRAVAAAQARGNGTFSSSITVPGDAEAGTYSVIASDFRGDTAQQSLEIRPVVGIRAGTVGRATSVIALHAFYVRALGFAAYEVVTVTVNFPLYDGSTNVETRTARADGHGTVGEIAMAVPRNAQQTNAPVTVRGQSSGKVGRAVVHVVYRPSLSLSYPTLRPGTSTTVRGQGFIPGARTTISVTIARNGATSITLNKDVFPDSNGDFSTSLGLPSSVRPGTYTVSASQPRGNLYATVSVTVTVHPTIGVQPNQALPGQTVTVAGGGFGSGVSVAVSAPFPLLGGGSRTVRVSTVTSNTGGYSVRLTVPGDAASATVTITARGPYSSVSTRLIVQRPPTPTPTPTATPSPTPPPPKKKPSFRFEWVSLWYHPVREGSNDHIVVQGHPHTYLGIWAHVYFPNGKHTDFYQTTNRHGHWSTWFTVPANSITSSSRQGVILFQLWHGSHQRKTFIYFSILR